MMGNDPLPEDLRIFCAVVGKSSFLGASEELGTSPSYVTKRVRILEETSSTRLFNRTTRRIVVTEEGELVPLGDEDPR